MAKQLKPQQLRPGFWKLVKCITKTINVAPSFFHPSDWHHQRVDIFPLFIYSLWPTRAVYVDLNCWVPTTSYDNVGCEADRLNAFAEFIAPEESV